MMHILEKLLYSEVGYSDYSILEISKYLGFSTQSHFTEVVSFLERKQIMGTKLTNEASIEQIISEMSLEEKARIVTGGSPFATEPMEEYGIPAVVMLDGATGFNSMQYGAEMGFKAEVKELAETGKGMDRESFGGMGGLLLGLRKVQMMAAEKARNGETPVSGEFGCYPPGMCLGATWNPEPVQACAKALAQEMGSKGVDVILGPNVNIHRDPLGGRCFEGYSEDPYLVSSLAPHFVKGIEQEGLAASVKHFAANNQETDRMGVEEHIQERALREIYLPGFQACVDAGSRTVMSAYNKINGKECAMNHWLLTELLREEWGFSGFVVSDWSGAYDQVKAIAAGNDLAMPGPRGIQSIIKAVEKGKLKEETLDICIRNFLMVVLTLPAQTEKRPYFEMENAVKATEFAAREGITLLKNDGVLPLSETVKIAFYGKRSRAFSGSGEGSAGVDTNLLTNPYDCTTVLIGAEKVVFGKAEADTNIWVVTAGANGQEGADRPNMEMDEDDRAALNQAITEAQNADGKVILILNTAGPVSLMEWEGQLSAVICTYYPGMQGGKVLADILFGKVNPSGKLPLTYPKYYRDCPTYKNFPGENKEVWYGEGIYVGYRYYDAKQIEPLYPFGHGLSYTTFEMTELSVPKETNVEEQDVQIRMKVKNTGVMDGSEVVQVYVHDVVSKLDKPEKELKGFCKVFLKAGEEKEVQVSLDKRSFAGYCPEKAKWVTEPGEFDILAGNSSRNITAVKRTTVICKNPFGLDDSTGIGEIVANERAVTLINNVIQADILKVANAAIVFAPDKIWSDIWQSLVTPELMKNGVGKEEIGRKYEYILEQFEGL